MDNQLLFIENVMRGSETVYEIDSKKYVPEKL